MQAKGTRRPSGRDKRSSKVRSSAKVDGPVFSGGGANSVGYASVGERDAMIQSCVDHHDEDVGLSWTAYDGA